jgi:hypothetical protein
VIRKEEESSATDSLSEDVTDVTEVRKTEVGSRKKQDALLLLTAIPI